MEHVDIAARFSGLGPAPAESTALLAGQSVRLVRLRGEGAWHSHAASDETVLVIRATVAPSGSSSAAFTLCEPTSIPITCPATAVSLRPAGATRSPPPRTRPRRTPRPPRSARPVVAVGGFYPKILVFGAPMGKIVLFVLNSYGENFSENCKSNFDFLANSVLYL